MNKQDWERLTFGERAWKLGLIMRYMNNEELYYESGWLYIWPDGELYSMCLEDFRDEENYRELERSFISHYSNKEYHGDGLFSCKGVPTEVVDAAHYWDEVLGLEPIEVIKPRWL